MPKTSAQFYDRLVERIRDGHDGAMCELVKRHGPAMERMAEQMVGRGLQAHHDAQDAVQAVCVTLWVGIRTGRFDVPTPDHFLALAKTLLSRQVARYWRKVKSEMAVKVDSSMAETLVEGDLSSAFTEASPGGAIEVDELLEKVLSQIDEIDRRLVMMRFQGYTTAEVAENLQVDSGFLRVRLGRLRRKFADIWARLELKPQ